MYRIIYRVEASNYILMLKINRTQGKLIIRKIRRFFLIYISKKTKQDISRFKQ